MSEKPYQERIIDDRTKVRTFRPGTTQEEMKWHQDAVTRRITPIGKNEWMFQIDNELPTPIDRTIEVPDHVWHRVIPGPGGLVIRIEDLKDR